MLVVLRYCLCGTDYVLSMYLVMQKSRGTGRTNEAMHTRCKGEECCRSIVEEGPNKKLWSEESYWTGEVK